MLRRPVLALALAATATLSSCGTVANPDVVARVGDAELTQDQLEDLTSSPLVLKVLFDDEPPLDEVAATRIVQTTWIRLQTVIESGLAGDDAAAASFATQIAPNEWPEADAGAQAFITDLLAVSTASEEAGVDLQAIFAQADNVWVNSRYGAWDSEIAAVVPLGRP